MARLIEVASQSETFSKRGLRKAKTNTVNSIIEWMAQSGYCPVVFSLDRPPLLAVRRRRQTNGPRGDLPSRFVRHLRVFRDDGAHNASLYKATSLPQARSASALLSDGLLSDC